MNENFLHYIWKFQLFNKSNLTLTSGEKVSIKSPGISNSNSGPDFFNGQIQIGKIIWAGNIEIHVNSSDWFLHQHQNDQAYSKLILHVVWVHDREVMNENNTPIPTLELKGKVNRKLLENYNWLKSNENWIPCQQEINTINQTHTYQMMNRVLVERLEKKSKRVERLLMQNNNDLEATLYCSLAKYFGFKVNAIPFELLANSTPFSLLLKCNANKTRINALLFGQAGMLDEKLDDEHYELLKEEYQFLKNKFKLKSLHPSMWKFMRMRPSNFPTIRIAQFAELYSKTPYLFQKILESHSTDQLRKLFEISLDSYWDNRYHFKKTSSKKMVKSFGKASIDILIINVIIPLLFTYGTKSGQEDLKDKSIRWLETLPKEHNKVTKKWSELQVTIKSAFESQALLELKASYCDSKNCLNCTIGNAILKS